MKTSSQRNSINDNHRLYAWRPVAALIRAMRTPLTLTHAARTTLTLVALTVTALTLAIRLSPMAMAAEDASFSLDEAETISSPTDAANTITRTSANTSTDTSTDTSHTDGELHREIELGIGYVSRDTARFGIHNGLDEQGLSGIAGFALQATDAAGRHTGYWEFSGQNLGVDSRSIAFEQGRQGVYRFTLDYAGLPTVRSDSSRTPFTDPGDNYLALPGNWVPATSTAGMTQLLPSLQDADLELKRERLRLGYDKVLPQHWQLRTSYQNETKDGISSLGAVIGNSGGNPRAVLLPQPIDYRTQQFDAALSYADGGKSFEIAYYLSAFGQGERSLTWQNPYAAISGWGSNSAAVDIAEASVGYPDGEGRAALPPDNQFHQISMLGGYQLGDYSHLNADIAVGRMTQNETFLPYTVNPVLAASITEALPRNSLDGRIDTTLFNLRFSSRPTPRFNWRAAWRYDNRDNKTPRDEYFFIAGDSITQTDAGSASSTLSRYRRNEPYSYREQKYSADASYRVARRTDLSAGVERRDIDRDYSEREQAIEDTVKFGIKSTLGERFTAGLDLARTRRHGSSYRGEEPFLSSYRPDYTGNPATLGWENHPDLRKYYMADRIRTRAALSANYLMGEAWTTSLGVNYLQDDYNRSEMGLTDSKMTGYTLDISYNPGGDNLLYGFYSHDNMDSDQDGRAFRGSAKAADSADPARDWFATLRDETDTVGLGFKRELSNTLSIGADYVYANARGEVDVTTGAALSAAPLPDTLVRLQSLEMYGDYLLRPGTTIKARYRVEKYHSRDWAVDGVAPNTLANVITLGEDSPDYTVHVILLSVVTEF